MGLFLLEGIAIESDQLAGTIHVHMFFGALQCHSRGSMIHSLRCKQNVKFFQTLI